MLVALQQPGDQRPDLGVEQGLASADRYDRRAALIYRAQALRQSELLRDRGFVLADPAAAGAGQVAGVQRFQHEHQRKPLADHRVGIHMRAGRRSVVNDPERIG